MERDIERLDRVTRELVSADMDALICTLPMNVLMLTGYWPVIGNSVAIVTREGRVSLLVPGDELDLAHTSWADDVVCYSAGSLNWLTSSLDSLILPLRELFQQATLNNARIGFESEAVSEPSSYAAMTIFGSSITELLGLTAPAATLLGAGALFTRLRSFLTKAEIERLRISCSIAKRAFTEGINDVRVGMREAQAAECFRRIVSDPQELGTTVQRADGFIYCMSGENSFEASAAFQRSRSRQLKAGDIVLIHCNSYADGFWTDITRTFAVGEIDERKANFYDAIFAARDAAFAEIRPGVKAKLVDAAARDVMRQHNYGDEFVHGLGHAVGFHAIDHNAPPRLHPASPDILEEGMVFNVEPAVYIKGFGGIRHCDMVAVTACGHELLTAFQSSFDELIIEGAGSARASAIW